MMVLLARAANFLRLRDAVVPFVMQWEKEKINSKLMTPSTYYNSSSQVSKESHIIIKILQGPKSSLSCCYGKTFSGLYTSFYLQKDADFRVVRCCFRTPPSTRA